MASLLVERAPGARIAPRSPRFGPVASVATARATALTAVTVALLEAIVDVVPDQPLVSVLTPIRLVLLTGLVAVAVSGLPLRSWRTRLDVPIGLLLLATLVSSGLGHVGLSGLRGLMTAVALYYLVVGVRRTWPAADTALAQLALLGVGIPGAIALSQATNGVATGFCRSGFTDVACTAPGAVDRVTGTFANPNILAGVVLLLLPVAVYAAGTVADRGSRVVSWALVALGALGLLLTVSRGGLVGLLVACTLAAGLGLAWGIPRQVRMAGAIGAAGLLVVAVAAGIGVRSEVWRAAMSTLAGHPLGVGPGAAGVAISSRIPGDRQFAHAHNLWLNWAVETGVVGGCAVLVITLLLAGRLRAATRTIGGSGPAAFTVAVAAALAGFCVISLADHPANTLRVALVLWFVVALAETTGPPQGPRAPRGKRAAARRPVHRVPGPRVRF